MVIKIDGIENKEFGKDKNLFLKFLKENTSSGKVSAQVEVFKAVDVQKDSFHWVMSTFDTDRDFEKVEFEDFKILISKPFVDFGDYVYMPLLFSTLMNIPKQFHYSFIL